MPGLTAKECRLFERLDSPTKIQDYLDRLPINFEKTGETHFSPRTVIREQKAHCIEGALLAAAVLWYHGHKPLLMDFTTKQHDEDHVIALFRQNGYWGAISKTNHPIIRWRDPIYKNHRELALSYFHEYFMFEDGEKTLLSYSSPLDMRPFNTDWIVSEKDLWWVDTELDTLPHHELVPKENKDLLRQTERFVRKSLSAREWNKRNTRT